ncbi:MAG: SpvB/TcaC N-terminal domain-containing protein, partial [Pseudomonadota bacterium]
MPDSMQENLAETAAEPASDERFALPEISLPEGGGAIRGLDERFSVNGANGTASFSLPLPVSPARGAQPGLALTHSSGGGNGPFGLGWAVDIPSIARRTDRGLPRYRDSEESDTYVMTGVEDLVPLRDGSGALIESTRSDEFGQQHRVRRYRPRIEGAFSRIERWESLANGIAHWRVTTGANVTSVFGQSENARLSDPEDSRSVFRWMCERRFDDRGNLTLYEFKHEDLAGIPNTPADGPRLNGVAPVAALYPKRILYGNRTPFAAGDPIPVASSFRFQTVFDYGEHVDAPYSESGGGQFDYAANPQPGDNGSWDVRPDAFSSFRSGFEVRSWRRCRRVMLFHSFDSPELVRAVDLEYNDSSGVSHLVSATSRGFIRSGTGFTARALPTLRFNYAEHAWNNDVQAIAPESLAGLRSGNSDPNRLFTDLLGEGIPGMLTRYEGIWHYTRNRGQGHFGPQERIDPVPALATATSALTDIAGDGRQRVTSQAAPRGQYTLEQDESWTAFRPFTSTLNREISDPNTRPIDLTGDGRPDLLITEGEQLVWYRNIGVDGHAPAEVVALLDDEARNPRVVFSDPKQSVFLADMTGDGLSDIVRIRNGAIVFWPNRGYGHFGARIEMAGAPVLDTPDTFDASRVRLADIDGSGPADLIYAGTRVRLWQNLSGNAWRQAPIEITGLPPQDAGATLETVDFFGQGTACLVWSSGLPAHAIHPLRVVDLMGGIKPHLMIAYSNGSGAEVSVEYASSTQFYLADRAAGRPWASKLPFPVHVVARTETRDLVAEVSRSETFTYHHGHYDTTDREFRGFARVDRRDAETAAHFVPS